MPDCKHSYVSVWTLEEIKQDYDLEKDEWGGDKDFGKIHKVIQAMCTECEEDLSAQVAKRLGVPSQ